MGYCETYIYIHNNCLDNHSGVPLALFTVRTIIRVLVPQLYMTNHIINTCMHMYVPVQFHSSAWLFPHLLTFLSCCGGHHYCSLCCHKLSSYCFHSQNLYLKDILSIRVLVHFVHLMVVCCVNYFSKQIIHIPLKGRPIPIWLLQ